MRVSEAAIVFWLAKFAHYIVNRCLQLECSILDQCRKCSRRNCPSQRNG